MNDTAPQEQSRLDKAQDRLATAIGRLEAAMDRPRPLPEPIVSEEDKAAMALLQNELAALRQDNDTLQHANDAAQQQLDQSIDRLKTLVDA